jgi:hypothetical protein
MINLFVREGYLRVRNCLLFEKLQWGFHLYVSLQQDYIKMCYSVHPIEMQHNRVVYTYRGFFFHTNTWHNAPYENCTHQPVSKEMGSPLAENLA